MIKTSTLLLLLFSFLILPTLTFAGGGGGSDCTGGTALSCSGTVSTSTGNCVGCDPTNANNGGGACCWGGSDINCDGTQDMTYSVEDMKGFTYTVPAGIACGSTYTITITTTANLQGNMYNVTQGGGINAGHVTTDEFGSSWMGGGSFTLTTTACAGDQLQILIDGYAGTTGNFDITLTCPSACTVPTLSSTNTNPACGAATGAINLTTSGGTSPFTYLWSDGQTIQDISSLLAGTYTVTVTATGGCTTTFKTTLTATGAATLSTTVTNASCGAANGSINLTVSGGVAPFTYNWSNGSSSEDPSSLVVGTYTVTVTGANSCTATTSAVVTDAGIPTITLTSQTNPSCAGGSDGAINISITGGTAPYTYAWSNGSSIEDIATLIAGTYTVTVTTAGGCTATASYVLADPVPITLSTTQVNPTCGSSNGSIDLTVAGGSGGLKYVWSSGNTTQDISSLAVNTYTVTVTDGKSCSATISATLTSSGIPTISLVTQTNVSCSGGSNGALDINVTGGTAPYTYAWSNGGSVQDITALTAGTYTVTVTTAGSCTATASWTITAPPALTVSLTSSTNVLCACDATGAINITAGGGTPGYTYAWSSGASTEDLSSIVDGTYTVTVTDSKSCTATLSTVITEPSQITVALNSQTNLSCFGVCTGSATIQASGGTGPYDYSNNGGGAWQFSNQAGAVTYSSLCAGSYTYTVRDANNCLTH
ncbi:MAG: hypothetical protein A3G23_12235 [Bacteroidetes bacterium RIFCSPLOWO2_12_FULL_37_12]|nr:MAG: hypothetical protein A3G23_12235 [Bacteroidetes bacterium RIFCSPLOWO2_12_FULL_37_12]